MVYLTKTYIRTKQAYFIYGLRRHDANLRTSPQLCQLNVGRPKGVRYDEKTYLIKSLSRAALPLEIYWRCSYDCRICLPSNEKYIIQSLTRLSSRDANFLLHTTHPKKNEARSEEKTNISFKHISSTVRVSLVEWGKEGVGERRRKYCRR